MSLQNGLETILEKMSNEEKNEFITELLLILDNGIDIELKVKNKAEALISKYQE